MEIIITVLEQEPDWERYFFMDEEAYKTELERLRLSPEEYERIMENEISFFFAFEKTRSKGE